MIIPAALPAINPKVWVRLLVAALILLVGIGIGLVLAARHFEPKLEQANKALGQFEQAYLNLANSTQKQNDAINRMKDEAEQRKQADAQAAKEARNKAGALYGLAGSILSLQPTPGADLCAAARDEFDAALVKERAAP